MYVLVSPCILDSSLRARGITSDKDRDLFSRAMERCRTFGIEVVPLPCPETIFLGKDREPGHFLGRLDTPAFSDLVDRLEDDVRKIIAVRGNPLCIIGVDSSPACGVNRTWYGESEGRPARIPGRGVFLVRFPDIRACDVSEFACYRIYLAAPLFSEAERNFNLLVRDILTEHLFTVYLPQETGDDTHTRDREEHRRIFERHLRALCDADTVVAVIDGSDADSGTSWEMGYASARGIRVIALRTDFRTVGLHERVNLMLEQSSEVVTGNAMLLASLHSPKE